MNSLSLTDLSERFIPRMRLRVRLLDHNRVASTFSREGESDAIQRVYVINLDRRPDRWHRLKRELNRFRERHGAPLSSITRRFSAIDARYLETQPDKSTLIPRFTLAEQLTVDPNPLLQINDESRARVITMTRQEVAVALSHIEVWKLIANGDVPSTLVLEDDVFMPYGFARSLEGTWSALASQSSTAGAFDLLYLSFEEAGEGTRQRVQDCLYQPTPGIWQASGYVLSKQGARKLLALLPMHGPVDLWLNFQFGDLNVYTAAKPLIEQRVDEPSTNSYSVLPVLSQVGIITREKPLIPQARHLKRPIIAYGEPGTGLTALATALSMIGYTCCSDLSELPGTERDNLLAGRTSRAFDAYVNIGSLDDNARREIARQYPDACFIDTSTSDGAPVRPEHGRTLQLDSGLTDKWAAVSKFLEIDYPPFPYPNDADRGQRLLIETSPKQTFKSRSLRFDESPWILRRPFNGSHGIATERPKVSLAKVVDVDWAAGDVLVQTDWKLRNDTFPSNLALFSPENFDQEPGTGATLTLRKEPTAVRAFTSAAIASQKSYLYGTFAAELRPARGSGLITGLFLHRNGPRQEIDIEFLGKDTRMMLVNVFYNPGAEGTKLEFGYRGTPTAIDLGFDAAEDFHRYEIEWMPGAIRWRVDGALVFERAEWDPTPIPNQPLEFNVNLWHSRSKEFAGSLSVASLPAVAELKTIEIHSPIYCGEARTD